MLNKPVVWICLCVISASILFSGSFRVIFFGTDLPIIAYHNFNNDINTSNDLTTTPDKFRSDLIQLKKAGYTTIFFRDIIDYYNNKRKLPSKPIIITIDDGYSSNYEIAYPILKELNMKATIFILGINAGRDTDAITNEKLIPHFTAVQALEMTNSGIIEIQMHTYNLHKPNVNMMNIRSFLTPKTYEEYLKRDTTAISEYICDATHTQAYALAYPYGYYDDLTEQIMRKSGVLVTVTSTAGVNRIYRSVYGLYGMKRLFPAEGSALDMINEYVYGKYISSLT